MHHVPKPLSKCFQEGVDARQDGLKTRDNPYPPGTDERTEWDAGWSATFDLDEDDDPDSSRVDPNDDDD